MITTPHMTRIDLDASDTLHQQYFLEKIVGSFPSLVDFLSRPIYLVILQKRDQPIEGMDNPVRYSAIVTRNFFLEGSLKHLEDFIERFTFFHKAERPFLVPNPRIVHTFNSFDRWENAWNDCLEDAIPINYFTSTHDHRVKRQEEQVPECSELCKSECESYALTRLKHDCEMETVGAL